VRYHSFQTEKSLLLRKMEAGGLALLRARNEVAKNTNSFYNTKPRRVILIAIAKE